MNGITLGCFFLLSHVLGPQDAERNGEGSPIDPMIHALVCVCVCVCVHSSIIHFTAMRPLPLIMLLVTLCWARDQLQILLMFWGSGSRLGSSSFAFLLTTSSQGTSIALPHSCTLRSKAAEYLKTDQQILFYTHTNTIFHWSWDFNFSHSSIKVRQKCIFQTIMSCACCGPGNHSWHCPVCPGLVLVVMLMALQGVKSVDNNYRVAFTLWLKYLWKLPITWCSKENVSKT